MNKKYIGTNIEVMAEAMTLGQAHDKGFVSTISNEPLSESQKEMSGYLVEHANGFYQWLDKNTFENNYAAVDSYIDRLYVERRQLADRFQKLCLFTDNPNFAEKVPNLEKRQLLLKQRDYMGEYLSILNQRIKIECLNK